MKQIVALFLVLCLLSLQLYSQNPYPKNIPAALTSQGFYISMGTNPPGTFDYYPVNSIKLLPNPFNETAHLLITLPQSEFTLSIFDYSGKKLSEESTRSGEFLINGKNLPAGIYFYRLKSSDGKVNYTGKFEIQR